MKKPILILLSVMVLGMATVVNAKQATTNPATAAAIKLYKAGNYTQSYLTFSEIVKKDPSNALAYYYLGMSSVQLGRRDEAISNYTRAMELSPNGILGSYAKKGIKCAEDPLTCHEVPVQTKAEEESPEDKFIRGAYGSGLSEKARGVHEKQKMENIKREINRRDEIAPQSFKEYRDFSSQGPSNEEIVSAIKTLQAAGIYDVQGGDYSGISNILGTQNGSNGYDVLNLLLGANKGNSSNLNPQIIQSLLTTQMTAGF